jgi:hypothetical protein
MVGDTVLASAFGTPPNNGRDSLNGVARSLRLANLTWGNFEETFSVGGDSKCSSSSTNCFAFQAPPSFARNLTAAGSTSSTSRTTTRTTSAHPGSRRRMPPSSGRTCAGREARGQITILSRYGVRVAFLGFAPYPWASDLNNIPAARRLLQKAAARADLVVVAIHAGAEGADQNHVPRGTEYFLGEARGNSARVHPRSDRRRGRPRRRLGAARDPRRRVVPPPAHRLLDRQLRRLSHFSLGGTLSLSAIFRVTLRSDGSFVKGRWISVRLADPGLPRLDYSKSSLHLVSTLSREDFGRNGARFSADGAIRG